MKFLVVLAVAVACVYADVAHLDATAPIVKSTYEQSPEGAFQYAYETANGIYAAADGVVKNQKSEYPALAVKGVYKYTSPEGVPVEVTYEADEDGFKPVSQHIPIPPPVPELIARSLAYIAAHPPSVDATKAYKPASPTYG